MSQDYELKIQYFLRRSTLWNSLNEVYLLCKLHISSFSMTKDIYIFSNWSFCLHWAVQNWYSFWWFLGRQNWPYLFLFPDFGQVSLLHLGKILGCKKQSKPTPFFNDSIRRNQELGSLSINRIKRFNLLFLFVTCFSDYAS